ncbi:conserved hypothetical protein [Thermobaculum terrenum ATCC BAA-798]|uniref:Lycopene cyclase domain protein n=1 Tax=Thermobaculum terrenum (strain ATCC BAA-798 / CCMEE 7001 / YNP1) TaxID=525904 RepID=D1CD59_THET1|nr:hypothetical protein [Thermobaculum terrenum]ACZ42724.1 conserved hypothetical protein [Thermobaculum terrenum ATCC BAA-798]
MSKSLGYSNKIRIPTYLWVGAIWIVLAEILLFLRVKPVPTFFTPIVWTGYILLVDGLVKAKTGRSLITTRFSLFLIILPWSIITWLVFEGYNLHLRNWQYFGLPQDLTPRLLGYVWAFATIIPGVLESADFVRAFLAPRVRINKWTPGQKLLNSSILLGALCLILPLLMPQRVASYMFALVWIGFILLLDPILYLLNKPSILGDLAKGHTTRLVSLLIAGVITGALWEFWNYWAEARWEYTIPYPLSAGPHYFEMPWLGFFGFIPFAIELFDLTSLLMLFLDKTGIYSSNKADTQDILSL